MNMNRKVGITGILAVVFALAFTVFPNDKPSLLEVADIVLVGFYAVSIAIILWVLPARRLVRVAMLLVCTTVFDIPFTYIGSLYIHDFQFDWYFGIYNFIRLILLAFPLLGLAWLSDNVIQRVFGYPSR